MSALQMLESEYDRYSQTVRLLSEQSDPGFLRVQGDMRRYLCLRCAGFLEQVTFLIISGYLDQKSSGPIRNFAGSYFDRAPNLNVDAFTRLIKKFGDGHEKSFNAFLSRPRRDALGDLLSIRNDVAHGRIENGQRLDPKRYVDLCRDVYDWLVDTFLGSSVEVLKDDGIEIDRYEKSR